MLGKSRPQWHIRDFVRLRGCWAGPSRLEPPTTSTLTRNAEPGHNDVLVQDEPTPKPLSPLG
jgi:hypothetical protein